MSNIFILLTSRWTWFARSPRTSRHTGHTSSAFWTSLTCKKKPLAVSGAFSIYFYICDGQQTDLMVFQVHRKNQRASPPAHVAWQTLIRAEGSKGKEESKAARGRNLPGEISLFQASIMGKGCSLILTKRLSYPTPRIKKHLSPPTFSSLGLSLLQSSPTQPR